MLLIVVSLPSGAVAWVNPATIEVVRPAEGERERYNNAATVLRHVSGQETRIQETTQEFVRAVESTRRALLPT